MTVLTGRLLDRRNLYATRLQYPALAGATRLFKRWMSSQSLGCTTRHLNWEEDILDLPCQIVAGCSGKFAIIFPTLSISQVCVKFKVNEKNYLHRTPR